MSKFERKAQSQRKHGPLTISGASKAPLPPPIIRPGFKGPGYVKKRPSRQVPSSPSTPEPVIQEQFLPVELQQLILDVFQRTFPASEDFETLKPMLRAINTALLQEDLQTAFGTREYREGYALRWSPSRSLAYANVLAWICDQRREDDWVKRLLDYLMSAQTDHEPQKAATAVCFGGNAAEVMAFAALLRHLRSDAAGKPESEQCSDQTEQRKEPLLKIHIVDIADWSSVVSALETGLTTPPPLSKYASATARASNAALLSSHALDVTFTCVNILDFTTDDLRSMIGPEPTLISFLLTLNDLYSTSVSKTTALLRKLETALPRGSLLLVLDSPGASYEVVVAGRREANQSDGRRQSFQMSWLLDRALMQRSPKDEEGTETPPLWEKLVDEGTKHHMLEDKLRYPVSLENIKFQVHVFRRL